MQSASIVQCGKSMGLLQGNGKENKDMHSRNRTDALNEFQRNCQVFLIHTKEIPRNNF